MRWSVVLLVVAGCRGLLGIEDPTVDPAVDASKSGDALGLDGRGIDAAPVTPPDALRVCPPAPNGCNEFTCPGSGSCYYECGHVTLRTWANARDFCVSNGIGCLATITTVSESVCIAQHAAPTGQEMVWMGYVQSANAAEPDGGWGWQCGSGTLTNWDVIEPNDLGVNEDCGALPNTTGRWNDEPCGDVNRFACELP